MPSTPVLMNERSLPRDVEHALRALANGSVDDLTSLPGSDILGCVKRRRLTLAVNPPDGDLPRIVTLTNWNGKRCRMRNVVRRSQAVQTFEFASAKMRDMLQCEYFHEFRYVQTLDVDWRVISIVEQPLLLLFWHNGRVHGYTPDFEIELRSIEVGRPERIVRDVKGSDWNRADEAAKIVVFPAIRSAFEKLGINFDVVTADEIVKEPHWSNVDKLLDYRFDRVAYGARFEAARMLLHGRSSRIGVLAAALDRDAVMAMIAAGDLRVDLAAGPLCDDSEIAWQGAL
ncbi:MAG: hypothetical protein JWL84_1710 [Rhodospirillales bacterium]|nr:hypothetical protein [Rhodospirillales bacterium]